MEVSGPSSATSGDLVTLTCTSSAAFPAPALEWSVHPVEMTEAMAEGFTVLEEMEDGAVVATSELRCVTSLFSSCLCELERVTDVLSNKDNLSLGAISQQYLLQRELLACHFPTLLH